MEKPEVCFPRLLYWGFSMKDTSGVIFEEGVPFLSGNNRLFNQFRLQPSFCYYDYCYYLLREVIEVFCGLTTFCVNWGVYFVIIELTTSCSLPLGVCWIPACVNKILEVLSVFLQERCWYCKREPFSFWNIVYKHNIPLADKYYCGFNNVVVLLAWDRCVARSRAVW